MRPTPPDPPVTASPHQSAIGPPPAPPSLRTCQPVSARPEEERSSGEWESDSRLDNSARCDVD